MINPVSLPSSAGINYGNGDVAHLSEGDALAVPSISNATRQLAYRDSLIALALNDVIAAVNNKEQFVPMPGVRTTLPAGSSEILSNFAIPSGLEARVLNATVSSEPTTAGIELDIYYAQGFGNSTGTNIVSTSTVYNGGGSFYNNGEFIFSITNKSNIPVTAIIAVLLTVRPLGDQTSALTPAVVEGPPGPAGQPGLTGSVGPSGAPGAAGTPGIVWMGMWNGNQPGGGIYSPPQAVSFTGIDDVTSSYIAQASTTSADIPGFSPKWQLLAGAAVIQGEQGPPGTSGFVFTGPWSPSISYQQGQVATYFLSSGIAQVAASTAGVSAQFWLNMSASVAGTVSAGSLFTVSGFTGGNAGLNGNYTLTTVPTLDTSGGVGNGYYIFSSVYAGGVTLAETAVSSVNVVFSLATAAWYAGLNGILPTLGTPPPGNGWTLFLSNYVPDQAIVVQEQQPAGTGSNLTSGTTRQFNVVEYNSIQGASLSDATVMLPAGTYRCRVAAPAYFMQGHYAVLNYQTGNLASPILRGSSAYAPRISVTGSPPYYVAGSVSVIEGYFTLIATSNLCVFHLTELSGTVTNGGGYPSEISGSDNEIYATATFWKVA